MTPSIGASAGLAGLIGAMIALGLTHSGPAATAISEPLHPLGGLSDDLELFLSGCRYGGACGRHGGRVWRGLPGGTAAARRGAGGRALAAAAWICISLVVLSFLLWYLWFRQIAQ